MKIYSWNVNGIRAVWNKGSLQEFIKVHQPDVLCLQETKAQQEQSEVDLPGYQEIWNSAEKKGYSGTAIFTKIKPLNVLYDFPDDIKAKFGNATDKFGNPYKEGRVLTVEFENFYLTTSYTPNSKGKLERLDLRHKIWDKAFLSYMMQLKSKKPVIFCGDLNVAHKEIDLANPKPNVGKHGFTNEERQGFQNFIDAGFIDTFRKFDQGGDNYTWWTHWANSRARNVGWRIDYFLVSKDFAPRLKNASIHANVMGSDHCPISIEISNE